MNLKTLADKLTTELTGLLNYVVTDDVQHYTSKMELGGEDYVPTLLSLITSFQNENRYTTTSVYQLKFRIKQDDRDSFYQDIIDFKATQLTEVIDSDVVTKVVQELITSASIVENGIDYFEYTLEMTWVFSLSKVGTNAVIKVDNVIIPFTECNVEHDVSYISNQTSATNYRLTNDIVILAVPVILANTKILELYNDVNSETYNKTYVLNIDGVEKTLVLKKGFYSYVNSSQLTGLILTFETHYPRIAITIDGISLPVSAYRYNGKKVMSNAPRGAAIVKGYASSKVRTWSITFVADGTATFTKLYDDSYGDVLNTTYALIVNGKSFTVELADSVEQYTETGGMTLECQFNEYGG